MIDKFGRNIHYMRISITDRCNLRCSYCMPKEIESMPMSQLLSYEEIIQVCTAGVSLGITHYKITGGEPLVRKNCEQLINGILAIPGVKEVTLTTNGILLKNMAQKLFSSGLRHINVSLDTLDNDLYKQITGFDSLTSVMSGIKEAVNVGLKVKLNVVLTKDNPFSEKLLLYAQSLGVIVRFIEMMPIGFGRNQEGISNLELLTMLEAKYGKLELLSNSLGNGPAVYYQIPGFSMPIGFISAIHGKFCHLCNRIRMTAQGEVKSCLCFEHAIDLRTPLRAHDYERVRELLEMSILQKPQEHVFEDWNSITEEKNMIQIGG